MPKNKKAAGGRPAKNFEPRYGEKKTSFHDRGKSGQKPGSKSPGHRGHRPVEEFASGAPTSGAPTSRAPKARWTSTQRAGRDEARGIRSHADRAGRLSEGRPTRSYDDRPGASRKPGRDGDSPRRFDDRPARRGSERSFGTDAGGRPNRSSGSDRAARSYGSDRPNRPFEDRPNRSFGSDRPARSFDDRPARSSGSDRPARPSGSDRPARSFDDRPGASRKPGRDGDSPRRFDDRPARRGSDRSFGTDAGGRPNRSSATDRPSRSYGDARPARPARTFDDSDRRSAASARPARSAFPSRSDGNATRDSAAPRNAHEQHVDVVHERLQADAIQATDVDGVSFGDLGLGDNIVRTLADLGATAPFAIQAATIPEILGGRDVLGRGRTGSGKTIAFGAPLVENVLRAQAGKRREFGRKPKALILAPTRELALQIDRTIQPIARSVGLFTTQIYGGVPQARQVGALKKGVDIIIGTPGRIEDLIEQRKLDLSDVMVAVIDEADHMCELGFLEPVQRILRETADGSQKLLFSATLDREVSSLVDEFLVEPAVHEVAGEDQASSTIEHRVLVIEHREKAAILDQLVDREGRTLVFARTRAYAEMLAEQFADAGIPAVSLHGDLNQARRTRNLERLTSGRVNVLVATDVAARGIHVDDIDLVIQADAPDEYKTYLHRSGRTGRAGKNGRVVTLITRQRQRRMNEMLERAEIHAPFEPARAGDDTIEAIRVPQ